jgi:hypothetical protein
LGGGFSTESKSPLLPGNSKLGPLTDIVKLLVTAMVAATPREESATLVAVTVTLAGDGKICGAVKTPLGLTVPQASPAQPGPLTVHSTPLFGFPAEVTLA